MIGYILQYDMLENIKWHFLKCVLICIQGNIEIKGKDAATRKAECKKRNNHELNLQLVQNRT